MNAWTFLSYAIMSIFDFSIIAGCAYLVQAHNWSAWWFVLAVIIISCSSFKTLMKEKA